MTELVKENKLLAKSKSQESLKMRELERNEQNYLTDQFH